MESERTGGEPKPIKTEFTFFPHNNETEWVVSLQGEKLKEELVKPNELLVQTLHELWRTNREKEIYEVFQDEKVRRAVESNIDSGDFTGWLRVGIHYNLPYDSAKQFLGDTIQLLIKATSSIPYDTGIEPDRRIRIDQYVGELLPAVTFPGYMAVFGIQTNLN